MIYYNFIIDYIFSLVTPVNSYLITSRLDKNKMIDIVIVSLLIDLLYRKPPLNLLILGMLFLVSRRIKVNKKYSFVKDIILFVIYFNVSFFIISFDISKYWVCFGIGLVFNVVYSLIVKDEHIFI